MAGKPTLSQAAALCAAAAMLCIPLTQASEGYSGKAYLDPAKILTQCYGETQGVDPSRIYSRSECADKLRARLAADYAPRILACLPELHTLRIEVFAALLDAGYNAGPVAVCNSRMARSIRAGDVTGACNGFYGWFTTARDRRTGQRIKLRGLVLRREKEAALCKTVRSAWSPIPLMYDVDYQRCATIRNERLIPHRRLDQRQTKDVA